MCRMRLAGLVLTALALFLTALPASATTRSRADVIPEVASLA